jgi:GNAT superfamily N-acetyltransferase
VLPGLQGHGVAERLLLAAEAELRASGCARVTLDTTEPLERAIRFYLRHGYAATGVTTDFFGMRLHEYAKHLGSGNDR